MIRRSDLIDGKYEILRLLGEGGMSRVWLARDFYLDKRWAIKEVDKGGSATSPVEVDCLVQEAMILRGLDHPALPRVVEVLETQDAVLMVMDYVRGKSLDKIMEERDGPVAQDDVVAWGMSLCGALAYLHSRQQPIIYRDMKPSNVMLCEDGTVRLVDFGIARSRQDAEASGLSLGTRAYAAPEQLDSRRSCDERSDLYSLGMTLARLAGIDVTQACRSGEADLAMVVRRATMADPGERYQSAEEMETALRECAGGSVPTRKKAVARPKRVWLFVAAGIAAAVCLGMVWCVVETAREEAAYAALLESARRARRDGEEGESDAERMYRQAIDAHPERSEPYMLLLHEVYLDDAQFTLQEASRWEGIAREHLDTLQTQADYARVCFEAGMLYYAYYEHEDVRAAARGAVWFEASSQAVGSEGSDASGGDEAQQSLRQQAESYAVICGFYRDLALARQAGDDSDTYLRYWRAIAQQMEGEVARGDGGYLGVGGNACGLRLCELLQQALESPVHLAGFARAGVTKKEVKTLWSEALDLSTDMLAKEDVSRAEELRWKEVADADPRIEANVAEVFEVGSRVS